MYGPAKVVKGPAKVVKDPAEGKKRKAEDASATQPKPKRARVPKTPKQWVLHGRLVFVRFQGQPLCGIIQVALGDPANSKTGSAKHHYYFQRCDLIKKKDGSYDGSYIPLETGRIELGAGFTGPWVALAVSEQTTALPKVDGKTGGKVFPLYFVNILPKGVVKFPPKAVPFLKGLACSNSVAAASPVPKVAKEASPKVSQEPAWVEKRRKAETEAASLHKKADGASLHKKADDASLHKKRKLEDSDSSDQDDERKRKKDKKHKKEKKDKKEKKKKKAKKYKKEKK